MGFDPFSAVPSATGGGSAWPARLGYRLRTGLMATLLLWLSAMAIAAPQAIRGVLDLRSVDFSREGVLRLDGDWAFYPGQLLSPAELKADQRRPAAGFLTLPRSWNGAVVAGKALDGAGIATFHLKILPPKVPGEFGLRLADVHSAYRLWLGSRLISAKGVIGNSPETEVEDPAIDLPALYSDGTPLDLTLQVSNHTDIQGGVTSSIQIGLLQTLQTRQVQRWCLALFFIGGLLVMGGYHLLFYCFRRKNRSSLYFAAYCLLWMLNLLAAAGCDRVLRVFLPALSAVCLHRIELSSFFLSVPVGYAFFHSLFPQEFSSRLIRPVWLLGAGFTLLALFAPVVRLLGLLPLFYYASLLLIVYCLFQLLQAKRHQRDGAGFMLVGFLLLAGIATNDMLYDLQLIQSVFLIQLGMFLFIMAQGCALASQLSKTFVLAEQLSLGLERRNQFLLSEMRQRASLEREIVKVSENERRRLSRDLHDGLCQQLTAARLRCAALLHSGRSQPADQPELEQLSAVLVQSVNQAYDLARGLWPVELGLQGSRVFLEDYCRRMAKSNAIEIELNARQHCVACNNDDVIQLYRIAQEAISNAVKHARASRIVVTLDCQAEAAVLNMSVCDNGVGCSSPAASAGGLGQQMMAHRARMVGASLEIDQIASG